MVRIGKGVLGVLVQGNKPVMRAFRVHITKAFVVLLGVVCI